MNDKTLPTRLGGLTSLLLIAVFAAACGSSGGSSSPSASASSAGASASATAPGATDTPVTGPSETSIVTPSASGALPDAAPAGTPLPRGAWVHGQILKAYVLAQPSVGWVYTNSGVWQTIDDGATWANTTPPRLIVSKIRGVTALDANRALLAVADVGGSTTTYYIWRTTDGGRSWAYVALPPIARDTVGGAPGDPGVEFEYVDTSTAFVTINMPFWPDALSPHIFATTDGGVTWTPRTYTHPDEPSGSCCFNRVQFATPNIGVAEAGQQISSTTTGWGNWTHRNLSTNDYSEPTIYFLSDSAWYGDLGLGYDPGSVTYNYIVSGDQGHTWTDHTSAVPGIANLNGAQVTFLGPLEWIGTEITATSGGGVGPSQTIYTVDGGAHWALMGPQPVNGYVATFIDASHGWTAPNDGAAARLYSTTNGGRTWRLLTP